MSRGLAMVVLTAACSPQDAASPIVEVAFEAVATDAELHAITDLAFVPGTDELLVLDKGGTITHLRLEGEHARTLGSFRVRGVYSELDCGLISLAFDPEFTTNRYLYVGTCIDATNSAILRLRFDDPALDTVAASAVEILRAGDVLADRPWHNIGAIGFEPGGVMWALFGDKTVRANGQSTDDALGAVVRIVPSRDPDRGGHAPAADNPWVRARERDPDVAAIGLRSPWRGALDSRGRLWIGDVGAEAVEEIDVLTSLGLNFGWAEHEGACADGPEACAGLTDPVVQWPHEGSFPYVDDDPEATTSLSRAAWVGLEHRPEGEDPYEGLLAGRMLVGDFCLGFVRAIAMDERHRVVTDVAVGHLAHASAWAQGPDDHVYASTFGSCEATPEGDQAPPLGQLWRAVPRRED